MKSFREWLREAEESREYKEYFKKILAKYNVEDPSELSKEDKQKFFDEVDAGWKGKEEEPEADDVNESEGLNYGSVIGCIVQNLKDPKSKEAKDVISYLGKNLK